MHIGRLIDIFLGITDIVASLYYEKRLIDCQSFFMAGDESLNWHPFLADFILVGQKLEQLGFTYFKGTVTVTDPSETQ